METAEGQTMGGRSFCDGRSRNKACRTVVSIRYDFVKTTGLTVSSQKPGRSGFGEPEKSEVWQTSRDTIRVVPVCGFTSKEALTGKQTIKVRISSRTTEQDLIVLLFCLKS